MLMYSSNISSRLQYAVDALLGPWYSDIRITDNLDEFIRYVGPSVCYDKSNLKEGSIWIDPAELIFQKGITSIKPTLATWKDIPSPFSSGGDIGFDVFAATFYMLSRYEEYSSDHILDNMGRFTAANSFAFKNGFLSRPIVDEYRLALSEIIESKWPNSAVKTKFESITSIDVDSAFAYKHKGFKRSIGGMAKDVLSLRFGNLMRRIAALSGWIRDDYDTYDKIIAHSKNSGQKTIWFFLLADFGSHDKNVPVESRQLRELIASLDSRSQVGIHPGVASNGDISTLKNEINRLVEITRRPCFHSRQHYLILRFPQTYKSLFDSGIRHEYSMGFADQPGFRAGTSFSFRWYDLESEQITDLIVHPFAYMDTTLNKYLSYGPTQASLAIAQLKEKVKKTEGTFISLWHNESFCNRGIWTGWEEVYEKSLK